MAVIGDNLKLQTGYPSIGSNKDSRPIRKITLAEFRVTAAQTSRGHCASPAGSVAGTGGERKLSAPMAALPGWWLRLGILLPLFALVVLPAADAYQVNDGGAGVSGNTSASKSTLWRRSKQHVSEASLSRQRGETTVNGESVSGGGLVDAFVTSLSMILVSEIGDETFIIAALMAMRHPRGIVLSGALSALFIMTILSTALGRIVPNLISAKATNQAATVLYTFFGLRLLYIAWRADPNDTPQKELEEVEEKLEGGTQKKSFGRRFFSRFCTPIFLESFILTFLAEWGDRSQIATIALAAHKNAIGVTIGATLGHTFCTLLAVVGGRLVALKISQRTVATIGGLLFLIFAFSSYIYPPV